MAHTTDILSVASQRVLAASDIIASVDTILDKSTCDDQDWHSRYVKVYGGWSLQCFSVASGQWIHVAFVGAPIAH